MIKAFGRRALGPFLGRSRCQRVFQAMFDVSLAGLNVGEGNHPDASGERFVAEYVRARCAPRGKPAILFDVGANVGEYARTLLEAFGPSARIWAFEPAEAAFRMLESNLGGIENVELRKMGLSDDERVGVLYSPGAGSKLGSLHNTGARLERRGMSVALEEKVMLTTIDRFCETERIERVDFLKLDVEGHELSVLQGAHEMIARDAIGAIQFEFGAANLDSRTYFRDFFSLLEGRYALYRVLKDGLYPVPEYKETHEVFKRATNYVAVRRTRDG